MTNSVSVLWGIAPCLKNKDSFQLRSASFSPMMFPLKVAQLPFIACAIGLREHRKEFHLISLLVRTLHMPVPCWKMTRRFEDCMKIRKNTQWLWRFWWYIPTKLVDKCDTWTLWARFFQRQNDNKILDIWIWWMRHASCNMKPCDRTYLKKGQLF